MGDLLFAEDAALPEVAHAFGRAIAQDGAEAVGADFLGSDLTDVRSGGTATKEPMAARTAIEVNLPGGFELVRCLAQDRLALSGI
ncbi:MAG: hypothetical protein CL797_02355 [Chromatiales bacterium]|nr:hypothetical protein [Chromatiales bacterium]